MDTVKITIRRSKRQSTTIVPKKAGLKPKLLPENHPHLLNYVLPLKKLPLYAIAARYRTPKG